VFHTPAGRLTSTERYDSLSHSYHPREFPVKGVGDIETMRLIFDDATRVSVQRDGFTAESAETAEGKDTSGPRLL